MCYATNTGPTATPLLIQLSAYTSQAALDNGSSAGVLSIYVEEPEGILAGWRMHIVPATREAEAKGSLESGSLSCSALCRSGVRTKFGINMVISQERGTIGLHYEG